MFHRLIATAAVATVCFAAAPALAAPANYTMVVDQAGGAINGVGFGPNATVTINILGDTTALISQDVGFGGPGGNCVTGPGTITVSGGPSATFLSGAAYICANTDGQQTGLYATLSDAQNGNPVHGSNSSNGTGAVQGSPLAAPGITMAAAFGPVPYNAGTLHAHGGTIALVGGGTYAPNAPEFAGTTASSFAITMAAPPATIPTLGEWAMIALGGLLAMAGAVLVRRRYTV